MAMTLQAFTGLRDRGPSSGPAPEATAPDVVDVPIYYRRGADGTWMFRIDNPAILGGGHATCEDAERCAVAALARALRGGIHGEREGERRGSIVIQLRAVLSPRGGVGAP